MDGNSTSVDPVNQVDAPSDGATADNPNGQDVVKTLQEQIKQLEEKHSNSSREAHKLVDDLRAEREARQNLERSLKKDTPQGYPEEESYVKFYADKGLDPEIARSLYKENKGSYENMLILNKQLAALHNRLQFTQQENEKTFQATNPDAQRAIEFFKGIPEIEPLSVGEKIQRLKDIQSKFSAQPQGRDTTEIKRAASGATGSTGRVVDAPNNADLDQKAKEAGFDNYKQMDEMGKCKTNEDFASWKKRWKK